MQARAPRRIAAMEDRPVPSAKQRAIPLLLGRTTFGARESELERARDIGYDAWIEEQLAYAAIDDGPLEAEIAQRLPTTTMSSADVLSYVTAAGNFQLAVDELRAATLLRQIHSRRQLYETMVELWSNHFSMLHVDGAVRYLKTADDRDVVRKHALGKFGDLLHASAKSPAMLFSLDNYLNTAAGPNENYSRELMELHTLGVGGGYTESDVKEVARAFTGWTIATTGGDVRFVFDAAEHDDGAKTVLGAPITAGQGQRDGEIVLDRLIAHSSTARFVATKLVRRFVSDAPPSSLVDRVAATYAATGGDIKAMLRVVLHADEFLASDGAKTKRPAELVVSTLRVLDANVPAAALAPIAERLNTLGQLPFMWPSPNGYPDVGAYWSSSSSLLERWNFGFAVVEGKLGGGGVSVDVARLLDGAATPWEIVDRLAARVLRKPLAPDDRAVLAAFVARGAQPHRPLDDARRIERATEALGVLLGSPTFQLR